MSPLIFYNLPFGTAARVGQVTRDENLKVLLSKDLEAGFPQDLLEQQFLRFAHKAIRLHEKTNLHKNS